jgi:RimJ/RimL family protein N-acetyltransferase/NTP pyrophosphatase (non-canonical NTP hydrolase)
MAQETSQTIREWGDATFGEARDLTALVARARGEMDELEQALRDGDHAEAGREAADVVILLHRLVGLLGMELNPNRSTPRCRSTARVHGRRRETGQVAMSETAPRHIKLETLGKPTLVLRAATYDDIPTLLRWDADPTVIASGSDDPDAVMAWGEDNDWAENIDLYERDVWEYWIAEIDGRPIGAMQLCDPHREPTHYWGEIEPNLRALDIWIGEPDARGKGYGEMMMRLGITASRLKIRASRPS